MSQERLTDLGILYFEKNIVKALNLVDVVVNYFATKHNNREIALFLMITVL